MKKNRKWTGSALALALVFLLSLSLSACGKQGEGEPASTTPQASETSSEALSEEASSEEDSEEVKAEKKAYDEMVKAYPTINIKELEEAQKKGEARLVYMGATYCPYCRKFLPLLDEVAKDKGWTVYYMDAEAQGDNFDKWAYGLKVEYIPAMAYVKDGKVVAYDTNHFLQPFTAEDIQGKVESLLNK